MGNGFALSAVLQLGRTGLARAVDATEYLGIRFDAVTDDTAVAVRAHRCQRVDRAFEAIEGVALSPHNYFKRFVIIILADFTSRHIEFVRARRGDWRCPFTVANEFSSQGAGLSNAGYRFAPMKFFWS